MRLESLINKFDNVQIQGNVDIEIKGICYDSRKCSEDYIFVAIAGLDEDGNRYIDSAVENGAVAVVSDRTMMNYREDITFLKVEDSRKALSIMSDHFYRHPSERLRVIGVTGTNGKTSTSYFIKQIFENAGRRIGVIGTLGARFEVMEKSLINTTPESLDIQQLLDEMDYLGADYVVMESSSQGVHMGRVDHVTFRGGVFTNLTQDHLDYHGTIEEYYQAKKKFLQMPTDYVLVNGANQYGERFHAESYDSGARRIKYGMGNGHDVMIDNITYNSDTIDFTMQVEGIDMDFTTNLAGEFNIYNVAGAILVAIQEGIEYADIRETVRHIDNVPGRMERIDVGNGIQAVVDYAHTPDGLYNVLSSLRKSCRGRLITVFGAGGDRDPDKRPEMGRIASEMSDVCIVTSDNPRWEDPESIIDDLVVGIETTKKDYIRIVDRHEALKKAISMAEKDDVILVAGKGHEIWQSIKGEKMPFDEKKIIGQLARERFGS